MEQTLKISGMMCEMCVKHVTKALSSLSGVEEVHVDLDSGTAVVKGEKIAQDVYAKAIEEAGYELVGIA